MPDELVDFGRILRPHGVRGELRVMPLCDGAEHFSEIVQTGKVLLRIDPERRPIVPPPMSAAPASAGAPGSLLPSVSPQPVDVVEFRPHGGVMLLRLQGCDSMNDAESLWGCLLSLRMGDMPPGGENEFYFHELEGLEVIDRRAGPIGRVLRVEDNPAHALLVVEPPAGGDTRLFRIPFVGALVGEVRPAEGRIEVDLPDGFAASQR